MVTKKSNQKLIPIIGSEETLDIIDSKILKLPCKIDTGAATSSIHCDRVRLIEKNGIEYLSLKLLDKKHPLYSGVDILTNQFKEKKVKSSFGDYEFRYQIKLKILFFGKIYHSYFTLSDRKNMQFSVLLGKRFLKNRFLVDVSKKNLSTKIK